MPKASDPYAATAGTRSIPPEDGDGNGVCGIQPPRQRSAASPATPANEQGVRALSDFPGNEFFRDECDVPAVSIPAPRTSELRRALMPLLRTSGKHVLPDPHEPSLRRLLVLKEGWDKDDDEKNNDDDEEKKTMGKKSEGCDGNQNGAENNSGRLRRGAIETLVQFLADPSSGIRSTTYRATIEYRDLTAHQVLVRLLPPPSDDDATNAVIPSAFETVGSIAHLNLPDTLLPYKYWIGKVLLDKNPALKTVVNKVGAIHNEYRVFDHEILAGNSNPGWSVVTVKEDGCAFELDFAKVYWNSRLAGEHHRMVQHLRDQATAWASSPHNTEQRPYMVADLMAGVGPFAVPLTAARSSAPPNRASANGTTPPPQPQPNNDNNIVVYANDLNPVSFQYLQHNAQTNKCQNLHCYNQDARAFVHWLQQQDQQQHQQSDNCIERIDHVIMNLPASAPEFLDAFRGWSLGIPSSSSSSSSGSLFLPTVHVHCFAPKVTHKSTTAAAAAAAAAARENDDDSYYATAVQRCERALGCPLEPDTVRIHIVRNVSPSNNMLCISFPLPRAVTLLERITLTAADCTTPTTTTTTTTAMMAETDTSTPLSDQPAAKRTKVQ